MHRRIVAEIRKTLMCYGKLEVYGCYGSIRSTVKGGAALVAAALVGVVTAAPGHAGDLLESRASEEARWTPSLGLTAGITFGQQEAGVVTTELSAVPPQALRDSDFDSAWSVTPYVGVNLELMTPTIPVVPGRLRAFVVGEYLPTFSATRQIAKEGEGNGLILPDIGDGDPTRFPEEAIKGEGSVTESTVQTNSFAAAIGLLYPVEVRGRILRIKPSVGWYRYGLDVSGRAFEAQKDDPALPPPFGPNIRFIELVARESKIFDSIGPGLQFELDLTRRGWVRPTIYLDLYAYRLLTDPEVNLSDTTTISDALGGPDTYSANWYFRADDWLFRGGAGVRVRWVGR
jgi:hypothetical protein